MDITRLKTYRFDPPGNWRWPCRFSLDELKEIYSKLFGFKISEHYSDRLYSSALWKTYDVREDSFYCNVRIEDGGSKRLEYCTIEELDWFLLVGESFLVDDPSMPWQICYEKRTVNPLFGEVSREEALIALDLVGECSILETTDHDLGNSRQK